MRLTKREEEVMVLLCTGSTNKEIAKKLRLSIRTIQNHLSNIYAKTACTNRIEASLAFLRKNQAFMAELLENDD